MLYIAAVNQEKFQTYISNPSELSEEDIPLLEAYVEKYPFCQIGHILLAKLSKEYNHPDKTLKLNHAALRTVNRAVLKNIMENGWSSLPHNPEPPPAESQLTETITENTTEVDFNNQDEQSGSVITKDQSEFNTPDTSDPEIAITETELQDDSNTKTDIPESENSNTGFFETEIEKPTSDQAPDSESIYSDVTDQIIVAIAENKILREKLQNMNADDIEIVGNTAEEDNKTQQDEVIPESPNTSLDSEGENEGDLRKKQQFEIIDNFIINESSLVRRKLKVPEGPQKPQEDLSLKSSSLNDELISENLAIIMKDQGKIDKAIDIYKKLIWKIPQKKAYFASLIEELKK